MTDRPLYKQRSGAYSTSKDYAHLKELLADISSDDRPLTPEILIAVGYVKDGNDSFDVVDDINDDFKNYRRISLKISDGDCQLKTTFRKYANSNEYLVGIEGKFKQKEIKISASRQITAGEFNTLLDIVGLKKI